MIIGSCILTGAYVKDTSGLFGLLLFGLVVTSFGVGGEFSLASVLATERAQEFPESSAGELVRVRGRVVTYTFAMQGWGYWFNSAIICIFLSTTGLSECIARKPSNYTLPSVDMEAANSTCSKTALEITWRGQFGVSIPIILCLLFYRWFSLQESFLWLRQKKENQELEELIGKDQFQFQNLSLLIKYYWPRLLGTSVPWFLWDVSFYGNKMFQVFIISSFLGTSTVLEVMESTLLNNSVAVLGYYLAAMTIDKPFMGRVGMQHLGFLINSILYITCAVAYSYEGFVDQHSHLLFGLYLVNTLFGQWGPNCTTWLLASEVFPTELRSHAHGISAAFGKLGALISGIVFQYGAMSGDPRHFTQVIFWVSGSCCLVALIFSVLFSCDVTTLDLREEDKRWKMMKEGKEYSGPAVFPEYLSVFEYRILGRGESYSFLRHYQHFFNLSMLD
eukprot:TRINITY_DN6684_c0_g1_i1.p1 TRINITY_DN6684_c0_g1~~TRINITY_DN6684_c0_g1_i1.p1  ORF type:complete len:447 (-),score=80.66 TRINITY_DN6684_c0_g1_i1:85-1425(-)